MAAGCRLTTSGGGTSRNRSTRTVVVEQLAWSTLAGAAISSAASLLKSCGISTNALVAVSVGRA
jgi:hypothetical protein